ncbi:protein CHLOROPLAST IMPORT APPARATUS 2-like isoform X2 [Phragmites australis]|uniref:protein CHLOROPLAST IMPORT APPARATUS 2-like isoform X2 n=1 Tax=Phragmites australis TaxID=29695 RepID=UPI002D76F340|nr:protein CHLOROPLAST IMPORT APPARATUS 2-like isoform X2 [Phragmites australis]
MASSCIPAGLRLDLEMVKAAAAGAVPPRPAHSAASSTLSEASNASSSAMSSVASLSLKRPRTPRKRPNQTYNEAAALLASMYPSVFPVAKGLETAPPRLLGLASAVADNPACSDLLPPFPVLSHAAFLLRDLPKPQPTPRSPVPAKSCPSPAAVSSVFSEFRDPSPSSATSDAAVADEPGELDFDDDGFDADSILGVVEEVAAEGIDGIMGKLTMESNAVTVASINSDLPSSRIHPYLRSLMVLGLGFRHDQRNITQALKRHNFDPEWWMYPAIPVNDIAPAPPPSVAMPAVSEKKSKKKGVGREKDVAVGQCKKDVEGILDSANGDTGILALPESGLGLRLNTGEVLKAWCGRGSVFANCNAPDSPWSSANELVKHADSDMFPENGASGVIREGNILKMQHKEKQCTPLLLNKSREGL